MKLFNTTLVPPDTSTADDPPLVVLECERVGSRRESLYQDSNLGPDWTNACKTGRAGTQTHTRARRATLEHPHRKRLPVAVTNWVLVLVGAPMLM